MSFFAFEHIQQGNIRNRAYRAKQISEISAAKPFETQALTISLRLQHWTLHIHVPGQWGETTSQLLNLSDGAGKIWSEWMSGWCLDGCLDDICRDFKYIWKISGRRSIGSALFMICTMGRWERPGMQVAKASPELRPLKSVPKWGIPKSWGLPRGMEKQGLFGHVPAAGFFSHDDQKPA